MEYNVFKIPQLKLDNYPETQWNNPLLVFNDSPLTSESIESISKLIEFFGIKHYTISDDCFIKFEGNKIPLNLVLKSKVIKQIWYFGNIHNTIDLTFKIPDYQKFSLLEKQIIVAADFNKIILNKELKLRLWKELQLMNNNE
jgi:hypothetical protein